jgi:hypothetical protein
MLLKTFQASLAHALRAAGGRSCGTGCNEVINRTTAAPM